MHHLAFLDEFGDSQLDFTKPGISTHFIVAAVLLPRANRAAVEAQVEAVRQRFFQKGPMTSAKVGQDDKRRRLILEALQPIPFSVFALVVDKRELRGQGLRYKQSFYKFLCGQADSALYRLFPNLELQASRHGSEAFMASFERYVQARHIPNLFDQASFGFAGEQTSVLMQLADFLAGTLARCYDETKLAAPPERQAFAEGLKTKVKQLQFWPERFAPSQVVASFDQSRYNVEVANLSINLAQAFVHKNSNSRVPVVGDQVACLSYLLFHFRHIDPTRYVSGRELALNLGDRRNATITLHYLQTQVIAPLRDAGVLIASRNQKGYKLPASERDLLDFVNFSGTIIQPLLSRLSRCRQQVRMATNIDILESTEYDTLRRLIDEAVNVPGNG